MKQTIALGNMVDDGNGDYLRKGGEKINANFNEIYSELGDTAVIHSAGSWKKIDSTSTQQTTVQFGQSFSVNTTSASVRITLPKGTIHDYNKVIKLRDVHGTWRTNPVVIISAEGDTIKGVKGSRELDVNWMDVELVYCSPNKWEYVESKQVSRITNPNMATVIKKEFIATEGQAYFENVFELNQYNKESLEVYHRGNLLYYGSEFNSKSEYGSRVNNELGALDGRSILLREPCKAGDVVTVITYNDGVAQFRASYNRLSLRLLDSRISNEQSIIGSRLVTNLSELGGIALKDFGYEESLGLLNHETLEVYINGVIQQEAGTASTPLFMCEGAEADTEQGCKALGGIWVESYIDYKVEIDESTNKALGINFGKEFNHGDIVSLRWYNNDIGTLLDMSDIEEELDLRYMHQGADVRLTGLVAVRDFNDPNPKTTEYLVPTTKPIANANMLFDLVYPIGTIYENAINRNNPATYMGFGTWILWGTGKTLIGWSDDPRSEFNLNNNDLDAGGAPSATAGRTGGSSKITLTEANIPATKTDQKVLVTDKNGPVIVGGCLLDPTTEGPAYTKYREEQATVVAGHKPPRSIDTLPPYVTVYRWLRVA